MAGKAKRGRPKKKAKTKGKPTKRAAKHRKKNAELLQSKKHAPRILMALRDPPLPEKDEKSEKGAKKGAQLLLTAALATARG